MTEVKQLSQIVEDDLPGELRGAGGNATRNGTKGSDDLGRRQGRGRRRDRRSQLAARVGARGAQPGGKKPIIKWDSSPVPGPPADRIEVSLAPASCRRACRDRPPTDYGSHMKIIEFEPWDPAAKSSCTARRSPTAATSQRHLALRTSQIETGRPRVRVRGDHRPTTWDATCSPTCGEAQRRDAGDVPLEGQLTWRRTESSLPPPSPPATAHFRRCMEPRRRAHGRPAREVQPVGGAPDRARDAGSAERYAFDVFAKDSINFGIMVTYRQTWEPQSYQVGDLV